MATQDDVRRIAMSLPGTQEAPHYFSFEVPVKGKMKGYCWTWNERIMPKKPKVPNPGVLAIIVRTLLEKDILMSSDPGKFVVDPHYNGFPAVLVRLEAIEVDELEDLLIEAWKCKATPDLLRQYDSG